MAHIMGEGRQQRALFPTCLDEVIPEDHACRVIDTFVDGLDMQALGFIRSQAAATGRPGYDPRDLLKLYLYGYLQQVRSSRRLEAESHRNIEVMWLLGRLQPDHKTISDFRRVHREAVTQAGVWLIQWARAQAMLQGGWVAIDGSKFRAVSSARSVAAAREAMSRYLAGLDEADGPEHPEPEARMMRTAHEGIVPAYNVQTVVEANTGLIVAHEVTTEATDNRSLWPMAQRAAEAVESAELHVLADAGYSSGEHARHCEEAGIVTHIPANRSVNNTGDGALFDRSAFAYDESSDTLRCPAGQTLTRKQSTRRDRAVIYTVAAQTCGACPLKPRCTTANQRFVTRHWDEDILQQMHRRATPAAMRLRRCTVERSFAELKERVFGRRFLLRGRMGAACEMAIAVMAFNIKRLIRLLGAANLIGRLQPA